jgi:S1-C subfamily serine protease
MVTAPTTKRFPSSRCASAIQIVRPHESARRPSASRIALGSFLIAGWLCVVSCQAALARTLPMVTTNILQRTFHLRFRGSTGTCFTVDLDNRHYIVTAAHVVAGIAKSDHIEIQHDSDWDTIAVQTVGVTAAPADVAVLAPPKILSPLHPLGVYGYGYSLSQDVYFLGFPYEFQMDDFQQELNRGFPLPLVKKGIISALASRHTGQNIILIDGHNNPGFSGGPVVYSSPGGLNVCAVISGYKSRAEPVLLAGQSTPLSWQYNTGIIVATEISAATKLIRANPIGFELPHSTTAA